VKYNRGSLVLPNPEAAMKCPRTSARPALLSATAFALTLAAGCAERSSPPATAAAPTPLPTPPTTLIPPPAPTDISWEVRGEGSTSMGSGESVEASAGKNKLVVKDGHVTANGKDGGQVKGGDKILLDRDGQLYVNGVKRETQPAK
jgi:hypothetical protein